jgi:sugar O-acyltransferase (sialic acid O-acetyltransferase NeuD family)
MKKLALIGAGDLGQQIAWHAKQDGHYEVVGFFDDYATVGQQQHGHLILGNTSKIEELHAKGVFDVLMIAIGYKHFNMRAALYEKFAGKIPFGTIIHSSSHVDSSAEIGEGCMVYPGCVIDMNAKLDANVLLNVGCVIAHDSEIGKHSFLSPAVKVAGFVQIGECVSLGIGCILIDNIALCSNTRIGAGAVVINDIEEPGLYVGIPAKIKKPNP